jgi:hypothetical protein
MGILITADKTPFNILKLIPINVLAHITIALNWWMSINPSRNNHPKTTIHACFAWLSFFRGWTLHSMLSVN